MPASLLASAYPNIEQQMENYLTGKRPMPKKMKVKLDNTGAENIIHYNGSFR